jgi:hypothetical protein
MITEMSNQGNQSFESWKSYLDTVNIFFTETLTPEKMETIEREKIKDVCKSTMIDICRLNQSIHFTWTKF